MNDERLKTYAKWECYIGGGNTDAKLWIIGIEEGGSFEISDGKSINDSVADYFDNINGEYFRCKSNNEIGQYYYQYGDGRFYNSPVWSRTLKILKTISNDIDIEDRLFSSNSPVFLSNIYPLGKPKAKGWEYEEAIGLIQNKYKADMILARSKLFPLLIKDKVVIFNGKGHWHEAYKILGVNENDFEVGRVNGELSPWLRVHKSKKIIFTRHFANGMPNVLLDEISRIVKEWM